MASTNVNTSALFPNLDQLSAKDRGMFIKEHEFEASLQTMVNELNAILDETSSSNNAVADASARVQSEINVLIGRIESEVASLVNRYIEQTVDEISQVEAAYERLYTNMYNIIQSINVNVQNRTTTYDIVMAYKLRILDKIESVFGKKSPYKDGRSKTDPRYVVQTPTLIRLRDVDEGITTRSFPVIIDPNITQDKIVKICEFTPVKNGTNVPSFLAEINVAGDLFAFKGYLKSVIQNANNEFGNSPKRSAVFVSDYFINQDLPYSLKVLYDKERNKIAIAFKFDETDDGFTSIVKLDFSINLLVGSDLEFANENNTVLMDNVDYNWYNVEITNGNDYIEIVSAPTRITYGGSIKATFLARRVIQITSQIASNSISFDIPNNLFIDRIISLQLVNSSTGKISNIINPNIVKDVINNRCSIVIPNANYYGDNGVSIICNIKVNEVYTLTNNENGTYTKNKTHYVLPDLDSYPALGTIKMNDSILSDDNWDFDENSGLLIISNVTGNVEASISARTYNDTETVNQIS